MPIQYLEAVKQNFNCWSDPLQMMLVACWLGPSAWGKWVFEHSGRCKKLRKNKGCARYKLVLLSWTPTPSGGIEVSGERAVDCLFFSCNAIHHAISIADNRFQAKCYGMRRRRITGTLLHILLRETTDKPNHFLFIYFELCLWIFFRSFLSRFFVRLLFETRFILQCTHRIWKLMRENRNRWISWMSWSS